MEFAEESGIPARYATGYLLLETAGAAPLHHASIGAGAAAPIRGGAEVERMNAC
jgi:hypothetical protein